MTAQLHGVPEEQVLEIGRPDRMDPEREAAFAFARKLTREPASITKEDIRGLEVYFSKEQIVELTLAVCRFNTMNRLADAFGCPLEHENVFARKKGGHDKSPAASKSLSSKANP